MGFRITSALSTLVEQPVGIEEALGKTDYYSIIENFMEQK